MWCYNRGKGYLWFISDKVAESVNMSLLSQLRYYHCLKSTTSYHRLKVNNIMFIKTPSETIMNASCQTKFCLFMEKWIILSFFKHWFNEKLTLSIMLDCEELYSNRNSLHSAAGNIQKLAFIKQSEPDQSGAVQRPRLHTLSFDLESRW